jgi:hypothetical protein
MLLRCYRCVVIYHILHHSYEYMIGDMCFVLLFITHVSFTIILLLFESWFILSSLAYFLSMHAWREREIEYQALIASKEMEGQRSPYSYISICLTYFFYLWLCVAGSLQRHCWFNSAIDVGFHNHQKPIGAYWWRDATSPLLHTVSIGIGSKLIGEELDSCLDIYTVVPNRIVGSIF